MILELNKISQYLKYNTPLRKYTWLKVGGKAEIFFQPESINHIQYLMDHIPNASKIRIIGAGSNIIIDDNIIKDITMKLEGELTQINIINDNLITVGAGCYNKSLVNFALQNNMGGLEFLSGIPGTIGGGISMNAGAYGKEFGDIIHSP